METKVCKRCGKELPVSLFAKKTNSPDGYQSYCKECANEYAKIRTAKRREEKETLQKAAQAVADSMPESDTISLSDGRTLRRVSADCKPLSEYNNRELLEEIKKRGYIWDTMYLKMRVEYSKI